MIVTHHLICKTQMVFPFYLRTQVVGVAVLIRHTSGKSPHSADHCFRNGGDWRLALEMCVTMLGLLSHVIKS